MSKAMEPNGPRSSEIGKLSREVRENDEDESRMTEFGQARAS